MPIGRISLQMSAFVTEGALTNPRFSTRDHGSSRTESGLSGVPGKASRQTAWLALLRRGVLVWPGPGPDAFVQRVR
jgi:hypothetical protein